MAAKIYTKTGDKGETGLVDGHRVPKSNFRLECYGTVDELNSALGIIRQSLENYSNLQKNLDPFLDSIQHELFNLGSRLACGQKEILTRLPNIEMKSIAAMETKIDQMTQVLPELKNFILPGGIRPAAELQWARTICRRAERHLVKLGETEFVEMILIQYLNRLSDFLFVMARYANFREMRPESIWKKDP